MAKDTPSVFHFETRVVVEMFCKETGHKSYREYGTKYHNRVDPGADTVAIKSLKKIVGERKQL